MQKVELEIVAISQSNGISQLQSYAIILGEINGLKKIPILIGSNEAQSIIIILEKMSPSRPLTHDLMKNFFDLMNIEINEIYIYKLENNIFFSKIIYTHQNKLYEIDSRTSDAIALAVRSNCPIYTNAFILDEVGVIVDKEESHNINPESVSIKEKEESKEENLKRMSLDKLNKLLQKVVEQEDYLRAVEIRNEIQKRKS